MCEKATFQHPSPKIYVPRLVSVN